MSDKPRRACIVYDCFGVGALFKKRGYEVFDYKREVLSSEYDLLVFTGGSDIDPKNYGEKAVHCGGFSLEREKLEQHAYVNSAGKLRVGICRGGQFLNIRSGGKLWQDVDKHSGDHTVLDVRTGKTYVVSSAHHQMMIPPNNPLLGREVIATAKRATTFSNQHNTYKRGKDYNVPEEDIEAIYYPIYKNLCFQWHPEFGPDECTDYSFNLIDEKYNVVYPQTA